MSRNFFDKVERFISNVVIITLILLISVQIVMKNEDAYNKFQIVENKVREFLNLKEPEKVVEVTNFIDEKRGYLTVDLLQDLNLPQVWLVKNGERVANFSKGIVRITVKEGDLITIDSRYYPEPLWFQITSLSSSIKTWQVGQQFRTSGQEKIIGVVQFYNKL